MIKETPKTLVQCLKLIDGVFTPSQVSNLISDLIDTKINYHKLLRLRIENNGMLEEASYDEKRLEELYADKNRLMTAVKQAEENGKKIKLMSLIDIEYID